jgi:hypothetical protein
MSNYASLWFIYTILSNFATNILEIQWLGMGIDERWKNE